MLERGDTVARRPSLAGYLNVIYPNKVQILGTEELAWLDGLDSRQRWETIAQDRAACRRWRWSISKDQPCPDDLRGAAEEIGTAAVDIAQARPRAAQPPAVPPGAHARAAETLHGVFMEIFSIGVLITGESGSGKSELALELITRGHRLVADDAPEFTQIAPDVLDGTCPEHAAGHARSARTGRAQHPRRCSATPR